jgi:hypothetical protein
LPKDFSLDHGLIAVDHEMTRDLDRILIDGETVEFLDLPGGPIGIAPVAALVLGLVGVGATAASFALGSPLSGPSAPKRAINPASRSRGFEGVSNSTGGGHFLPFGYGQHRVGGHMIYYADQSPPDVLVTDSEETSILKSTVATAVRFGVSARVAIAAGPIEEIADIQIDGNPITDYKGAIYTALLGEADDIIPRAFLATRVEKLVQAPVTVGAGPVIATSDTELDFFEVLILFTNGLWYEKDQEIHGPKVELKVEYREMGASTWIVLTGGNISHRDRSVAPVEMLVRSKSLLRARYDVRVTRITSDTHLNTTVGISQPADGDDVFRFEKLIQVQNEASAHPGIAQLAVVGISLDQQAQTLGSTFTTKCKFTKLIRVYTTTTSFSLQWTQSPAWCAAHFITDKQWGLGRFFDYTDIDIAAFLDWASYCSAQVSDGRGGMEPRCLFDYYQDVQEPAQEVLRRIALAGDAALVNTGGKWRPVIDRASATEQIFSEANIQPGSLVYRWIDRTQLATRIFVDFLNQERSWRRDVFTQDDETSLLTGESPVEATLELFGVTRPSQVARFAARLMRHNQLGTTEVDFVTGLEGLAIGVGSVFGLSSKAVGAGIGSGKVIAVGNGGKQLYLDEMVNIVAAKAYTLTIQHARENTIESQAILETGDRRLDVVTVANNWTSEVCPGDNYSLEETAISLELFRCTELSLADDYRRRVRGRKYDPAVYTFTIVNPTDALPSTPPDPRTFPTHIIGTIKLRIIKGSGSIRHIHGSLPIVKFGLIREFEVFWKFPADEGYNSLGVSRNRSFRLDDVKIAATYEFLAIPISPFGQRRSLDAAVTSSVVVT